MREWMRKKSNSKSNETRTDISNKIFFKNSDPKTKLNTQSNFEIQKNQI